MSPDYSRVLLIQAGHAPADLQSAVGNMPAWFERAIGAPAGALRTVRPFEGEPLPGPQEVGAAIITGSWAMVTDREPWSVRTAHWIRAAMDRDVPMLGVCYGHQLMAQALGGRVDYHPAGQEVGTHEVELSEAGLRDAWFDGLPARFPAHLTHLQSVLEAPRGSVRLAHSAHDSHQAIRYGPHAVSFQFHPEFTPAILAACISRRADALARSGFDVPALLAGLRETAHARQLLGTFVRRYAGAAALA